MLKLRSYKLSAPLEEMPGIWTFYRAFGLFNRSFRLFTGFSGFLSDISAFYRALGLFAGHLGSLPGFLSFYRAFLTFYHRSFGAFYTFLIIDFPNSRPFIH
jgi:hypothetical protein